ncbi:MAG: HAD-IIB family hydrolase [Desulfamplus sp.]|nr:HAD-IIB family hydrolase [Desulfamplus sp.]
MELLNIRAVVCDLDGTLLHSPQEAIKVPGRTRASFFSADASILLEKISKIFPVVIATGRNSNSVYKLVSQLPDVRFIGFVLENGFVVKHAIDDTLTAESKTANHNDNIHLNYKTINNPEREIKEDWNKIAALFPDWERLLFYENCAGFIFDLSQNEIYKMAIDAKLKHAQRVLAENGYSYPVYKEKRKIFIYPGHVDKMRGLELLGVHPYIAMGDGENDLQMMQQSTIAVSLDSGASELKEIVMQKNGFWSMKREHEAACEMLEFAYNLLLKTSASRQSL